MHTLPRVLLCGALAAIPLRPAVAASLACEPGSRPLLEVLDDIRYTVPAAEPDLFVSDAILICHDGRVAHSTTAAGEDRFPRTTELVNGRARPETMARLSAAMAAFRIGFQRDCRADYGPGTFVRARITWHGLPPRRNSFSISPSAADDPLPLCPGALAGEFVDALLTAVDDAKANGQAVTIR